MTTTQLLTKLKEKIMEVTNDDNLPPGYSRAQIISIETIKESDPTRMMSLAYRDGYDACLKKVLSLITELEGKK